MQPGGLECRHGKQATKRMKRAEAIQEMGSDGQTILSWQLLSEAWRLRSSWLVAEGSEVRESQRKERHIQQGGEARGSQLNTRALGMDRLALCARFRYQEMPPTWASKSLPSHRGELCDAFDQ